MDGLILVVDVVYLKVKNENGGDNCFIVVCGFIDLIGIDYIIGNMLLDVILLLGLIVD